MERPRYRIESIERSGKSGIHLKTRDGRASFELTIPYTTMILFHATASHNLETIMKEGLRPNSYWSQDTGLRDYYMETIEDDGEEPVVLTITLEHLMELTQGHHTGLEPDYPGLEEPITSVLGKSEEAIQGEWRSCTKNWQSCLNLIGSLRCPVTIPAEYVKLLAQDPEARQAHPLLLKTRNSQP